MQVKLTNSAVQRLLSGLRSIDASETTKLSGLVRLDLAKNINRLMPNAVDFENATRKRRRDLIVGEKLSDDDRLHNNPILGELDVMSEKTETYDLIELATDKLRLDDNSRITSDQIASLAPIMPDFDSLGPSSKEGDK